MWNFKFSLCCLCLATFASGAEVSFLGDNKLTGEIIAMDADGTISMTTAPSDQSIRLNADKIVKIDFGKSDQKFETPAQNITLINGDTFPIEVRGLDNKVLKVSTPFLGELDIPREMIDSLDIGMFSKKSIYSGPKQVSEWQSNSDEVSKWQMEEDRLVTDGYDLLYRDMKLPENYSVRFKISWDAQPNFHFYFGDPMDYSGKATNRYYLQFAKAGMEIKRETTGKLRYKQIAVITRLPQEFTTKELWIEVRVNRKLGRVELYLNDQLEGRWTDSNPDIPSGTGIAFSAQATEENKLRLSEIEISEWEDRGDRHRSEDRGDGKQDALIGRNGERFGGSLISITSAESGMVYRFKSNFQEEPLDLPDTEVSSIYFAKGPVAKTEKFDGLSLFFQGRGSIQASKCVFNENTLSVTHPLLGDLQLNRPSVSRLERRMETKSNPTKDE
ncbi:MAG: hypothetical protein V4727_10245 [Verrucomicrobiota bacterium]